MHEDDTTTKDVFALLGLLAAGVAMLILAMVL